MAAKSVTLNDLVGYSPVAGLIMCNPSNICEEFYTISTDSVLARFLCIRRASCLLWPLVASSSNSKISVYSHHI